MQQLVFHLGRDMLQTTGFIVIFLRQQALEFCKIYFHPLACIYLTILSRVVTNVCLPCPASMISQMSSGVHLCGMRIKAHLD